MGRLFSGFSQVVYYLVFGGLIFAALVSVTSGKAEEGIMIDGLELPDCASRPVLRCKP